MKNGINDLHNHLFAQLERLNDEELTEEELKKEVQRSKAITGVSHAIIASADLALRAQELAMEYGLETNVSNPLLGSSKE